MFTGLIEDMGHVSAIEQTAQGSRLTIAATTVLEGVQLGDSVAIDGVCTTVVAFDNTSFTIEASPETLRCTTFQSFQVGTRVNLERPLLPTSRLGGHFVMGHVDGLATVVSRETEGISEIFTFELADAGLAQYMIPKGSVAVSGISLTINTLEGNRFSVAIIPHTLTHTNLGDCHIGDTVNIEPDMLGKYIQKQLAQLTPSESAGMSKETLMTHGFVSS